VTVEPPGLIGMPPLQFTYAVLPSRVVFGAGRFADLAGEVEHLGAKAALVLCTPGQRRLADEAATILGSRTAGIFAGAVMHVPVEAAAAARAEARRVGADCCVAVGGGSTIGLGKAIALESALPIIAVPTTYAGSEMTPIWGLTADGRKQTGRDGRVLPRSVIYDPLLTLSLPASVSGPSGINALAHCVEALYAPDANPIISLMAEEGIRALRTSLPLVVAAPADVAARAQALYGAWLAGTALGSVRMGLHHKLCHTLGGSYNLPHAAVHTVLLPHVVAYNRGAREAIGRVARALGADDPAAAIYDLAVAIGASTTLREIGMRADDLDAAAELATRDPYTNPSPVTRAGIRMLLEDAFAGRRPHAPVAG
jgi:alcohol dehydrogenase class IV